MDWSNTTNYDVLVSPPEQGISVDDQIEKYKSHVGNNRLQVFLTLYRQAYDKARSEGDYNECNKIVEKIVDTVCRQAVPRGRFLINSTTTTTSITGATTTSVLWHLMDEASAKSLLHKLLQPTEQVQPQQPTMGSNSNVPFGLALPRDDEGQKRRRRSSLLRRSASESMVGMVLDNKKKVNRMGGMYHEEPTWKSARSGHGSLALNRMDVILTPSRDSLDPNSQGVGNNRLHILIAMRSPKYREASVDGKEAILDEVIQTVNVFWKGRFLVETFDDGHEELTPDEVRNALRSILDHRSGQLSASKRHSMPLASIPRPTMTIPKQASMTMIPTGASADLPHVSDLRSAAVQDLQKQKARQTIASRLETNRRADQSDSPPPSNTGDAIHSMRTFTSPFGPQRSMAHRRSMAPKRESTVLGKLDASVMEQLISEFDDADCNDTSEPLPPTNSNQFGSQFPGNDPCFM